MANKPIIYIVDDEKEVRRATAFLLKTSGYQVIQFESGVDLLKEAGHLELGVMLLDMRMPEMDGLEIQAALKARGLRFPVIIFTGHGEINMAVEAMRAGAIDFIEKPFEKERLIEAIEMATAHIRDEIGQNVAMQEAELRLAALTMREREVLECLTHGMPNKKIAYDLSISPRTVEVHRANLMKKLGVRSFSDALRIAFAAGLHNNQNTHTTH
ncbi:response regulator transcription factor [Aquisediminimonas sediminicola]|uniref:response regulator transcription factor n=1 Tax=Alteraquisediminimonas sediminicola TaxID=2676787 RepID=UPI001C8D1CB0|nr:response regulator [Aquisediminimonas sediminicola]